ncbi:MAG: hypothetical protein ACLVJO_02700 [[Clostridium] scindens]
MTPAIIKFAAKTIEKMKTKNIMGAKIASDDPERRSPGSNESVSS